MLSADELFQDLRGEAHKFSKCCTLSVEDIQQELYIMCIEVTSGESPYNAILGTVREYIMGRLWGLVRRWRESDPLPDEVDGEASMTPELLRVPSVEQQLINCQERQDMESILDKKSKAKIEKRLQTSLYIVCTALSRRDAAKYLGITREAVRQRVHREEKQLKGNYLAPFA